MSEIWLIVVPVDTPKYKTLDFSLNGNSSNPFIIHAANLLLNGSQFLYSMPFLLSNFSL